MNIMSNEPFALKVFDKLVKPFLSPKLNYGQVREILKLKLIMDNRRESINVKKRVNNERKEAKRSTLIICITYFAVGILIALMQIMNNIFGANILAFAGLIFMLFSVYINEFSAVLLDTTEKAFYGALPIGHNEMNVAKNIHIAYYIGIIGFSMILPSVIMAFIFHGVLYGLLLAAICTVITVFCLRLAGLIYYVLLKTFSGERLKDILSGFQVFITIAMILAYQIVPRIIDIAEFSKAELSFSPFYFILPSAWVAAIFELFFGVSSAWYYYVLTGVAVLAVVLMEIIYHKKIMPEFEGELEKLTETAKESKTLSSFSRLMCKILSKDEQENAFMKLVLIQISRNRDIKLKLYPQLANVFILPIIMLLSQVSRKGGFDAVLETIRDGRWGLALLYFVGLTSSAIYNIIGQSENKENILFYQVLPIENLSKCIRAGVKVVLFGYLTPIFLILSAGLVTICGIGAVPDVIIAYLGFIFITSLMIRLTTWTLPFSEEAVTHKAGYNMLMFVINFVVLGAFGLGHIILLTTLPLQLLGIAVTIGLNIALWKIFMNKRYIIERE